ncbi:hypothetical protein [Sulfuritalea sp.]|uniref:hypothetical protein n=1 Tax=Sulfuritalea sp. TaxID=2480090 RepID=UPI00286E63C9|nr:hypothetical protein [Sulfuritalea sp.]
MEVEESVASLGQAYAREVRWAQGFRVNIDSRLILLGIRRLLSCKIISDGELRAAAFVIGCRLGAMDSYESFDDGLAQGRDVPLAFAYALPSMPLACASICHSLRGVTYTVTGAGDAGIRAFSQAAALVESGAAGMVVTGCWESPSATAGEGNASCSLLLLVLEEEEVAGSDAYGADDYTGPPTMDEDAPTALTVQSSVAALKRFLARNSIAAPGASFHA